MREASDIIEATARKVAMALNQVGGGLKAERTFARELVRPELQRLGIDHLDPFSERGVLRYETEKFKAEVRARQARTEKFHDWMQGFAKRQLEAQANRPAGWKIGASDDRPKRDSRQLSQRDLFGDWGPDTFLDLEYYESRGIAPPQHMIDRPDS